MKKENSGTNGFDLDKNNIIKPTFDTLAEDDHKALENYRTDQDELFYSYYELMRQVVVLKDAAPIIICMVEVTPEVRSNTSLSLDVVQFMINSTLERQMSSNHELLRRLIEKRDRKKLVDSNVNPFSSYCAVNFAQTNPQTSGISAGGATIPNLSAQLMNHFHNRITIDGSTPTFGMPR
jgi:hypothetical protein